MFWLLRIIIIVPWNFHWSRVKISPFIIPKFVIQHVCINHIETICFMAWLIHLRVKISGAAHLDFSLLDFTRKYFQLIHFCLLVLWYSVGLFIDGVPHFTKITFKSHNINMASIKSNNLFIILNMYILFLTRTV